MSLSSTALVFAVTAMVALAGLGDARAASADDRSTSTGAAAQAFSSLPSGVVPLPPRSHVPASIPANERAPGFFFVLHKGQRDYVSLVGSAKTAKEMTEGRSFGGDSTRTGETCFAQDQRRMRAQGDDADPAWMNNLQPMVSMSASTVQGQRPVVEAIHTERIVDEGGHVSLETADAWVDPVTRGARLIGKSSVPLELVSTILGGNKIYAAREQQSVHIILVANREREQVGRDVVFAIAQGDVLNTTCDHLRVTLKTEKGQGETASFISNVVLPSLTPKDPKDTSDVPEVKDIAAVLRRGSRAETRIRPIHIHVSTTWASRDKEPLLTVSAGWDARERRGF